jgi:hypothetical protein
MPEKKCPKCNRVGDIQICFGYRKVPHPIPQSWCRECRNGKGRATVLKGVPDSNTYVQARAHLQENLAQSASAKTYREVLTDLYCHHYPKDSNNRKRSVKFMADKLAKRGVHASM